MYVKSIAKNYGKITKIMVYNRGVELEPPRCKLHEQIVCTICWERKQNPIPSPSSLMRSKTKITDYTLANDFDLFTTFTFDPQKVDSLDFDFAKSKMSKWLNNARRSSPELKYLIVAELHPTSGRIHFHALMKNFLGELIPAHNKNGTLKKKNNRQIFNIGSYHWGWSTAVKIDNIGKVSSYVQKYVTKDMLRIGNKKRFWCSRNLIKPVVNYNINMVEEVYSRPLFIIGEHREEYYKIYKILNTSVPLFGEAVEATLKRDYDGLLHPVLQAAT